MATRMIEGEVLPTVDPELEGLRAENRRLQRDAEDARREAQRAHEDAARALGMLRTQLGPLYRALQAVFGELDAAGVADGPQPATAAAAPANAASNPRVAAVWEAWKSKLGEGPAKVIDALLLHGDMNTTQLAIACRASKKTIPAWIYKLNQAGLLSKNAGRFSLKTL